MYELYFSNQTSGGSVIKADFEDSNKWMISSATIIKSDIVPQPPPVYLEYNKVLNKFESPSLDPPIDPNPYSYRNYVYRMGINIENLTLDGNKNNYAFGGIRLSNAANSTIRNVGVYYTKCTFLINTCWGGAIENCFSSSIWYGVLVISCNSFLISNSYFIGQYDIYNPSEYNPLISNEDLPEFINLNTSYPSLNSTNYSYWEIDENIRRGKTGIYIYQTAGLLIQATVVEEVGNGITSLDSLVNISSIHLEAIINYGISIGVGAYSQFYGVQVHIPSANYGFYFGKSAVVKLDSIMKESGKLYFDNSTTGRTITFSSTFYKERKYKPDIFFVDEGNNGQNYGSVYIDPLNGNDDNYGFNENDALETFDAALIRVQNQSTINPVKVIRIKEGTTAVKDPTIKELENCNLLITGYADGGEGLPNATIYFDGEDFHIVGEVLLKGNVNLVFRNVNLICNTSYQFETPLNQYTIFNLKQTYSKLMFENLTISLSNFYSLIKSNVLNNALVETKFIDTTILGGGVASLSPNNGGAINLLVDNVQIGSSLSPSIYAQFNTGWLDANTIRNNF